MGNRLCEKRNEQRRQELHREKLRTMKPSIDTEEPKCLRLDHIRNNLKREQLLEERYTIIHPKFLIFCDVVLGMRIGNFFST